MLSSIYYYYLIIFKYRINFNICAEKSQAKVGWINGGFFVFNKEIFNYIEDDSIMLEREPLEKLSKMGELMAYKHDDFWQCMDTIREKEILEGLLNSNSAPWLK